MVFSRGKGIKHLSIFMLVVSVFSFWYAGAAFAEGVTIRYMACTGELADGLQNLAQSFNRFHPGIKVEVEPVPYDDLVKKVYLDFMVKAGEYDGIHLMSEYMRKVITDGHIVPIDTIMDLDEVGWDDYYEYERDVVSYGGHVWGLPLHGGVVILYYRKDLLEDSANKAQFKAKYGYELKCPETWSQLLDMAEFFTRPKEHLYGIAAGAKRDDVLNNYLTTWMYTHNERLLNKNSVPQLDTPLAIEFVKYYKKLLDYAGPGAYAQSADEATMNFLHGGYVFLLQWADVVTRIRDPEQCTLDPSDVGFALPPKGDKGGSHSVMGSDWGLAISKYSKHKEATLEWIKFAATRDIEYSLIGAPTRKSTLRNPRMQALFPGFDFLDKAYAACKGHPILIPEDVLMEDTPLRLNQAFTGELSPEEAMRRGQKALYDALVETGEIKK